jgi:DNA-binding transcriptional ArsR family regulator
MRIPGKAVHVAIELWHLAGMKKCRTVKLSLSRIEQDGLSRSSAGRGLRALEDAGLVAVERHPGRCPIVTLLEYPTKDVAR